MHKARHTAGQRVLDATGNLKAVQQLLGHASIQTTGDIYTDWDIDQLAATMAEILDDDSPTDSKPNPKLIPLNSRKPCKSALYTANGIRTRVTAVRALPAGVADDAHRGPF